VNASRLSSFLRDHADAPGFELPNIDEGGRTNEAVPRRRHRPDDVRSSTADDAAIGSDDSDSHERGVVERYSTSGVVHSFDTTTGLARTSDRIWFSDESRNRR
jgi:hypothetical protein